MVISDSEGRNWTPDTLGFNIGMPPSVFVPGRVYTMRVQQTPNVQNLQMEINFQSPFKTFGFEDLGGGTLGWTGCLTCTRSIDMGTGAAAPPPVGHPPTPRHTRLPGPHSRAFPLRLPASGPLR